MILFFMMIGSNEEINKYPFRMKFTEMEESF
jgi:hypothetical protein